MNVFINNISVKAPEYDIHEFFITLAISALKNEKETKIFKRLAERCGIKHRYSPMKPAADTDVSIDDAGTYIRGRFPSVKDRLCFHKQLASDLIKNTVTSLAPDYKIKKTTHLIVVTSTGVCAPGIEQQIIKILGLSPSTEKIPVTFVGCHAAFIALKIARYIIFSRPNAQVLIVNVELCSLSIQEDMNLEQAMTYLIFGDGCSATIVSSEPEGIKLDWYHTELAPGTDTLLNINITASGITPFVSRLIPENIYIALEQSKHRIFNGIAPESFIRWAVHPGGSAILDSVEKSLKLSTEKLESSRKVLMNYGNMSSATILFVLKDLVDNSCVGDQGCAMGFGPGMTIETLGFEIV